MRTPAETGGSRGGLIGQFRGEPLGVPIRLRKADARADPGCPGPMKTGPSWRISRLSIRRFLLRNRILMATAGATPGPPLKWGSLGKTPRHAFGVTCGSLPLG